MMEPNEIETQLQTLNRTASRPWVIANGMLHRDYEFADFDEAFAFMTRVAAVARDMNHHPNWSNVYNKVQVDLVTHDAKGITELDFELARQMESLS